MWIQRHDGSLVNIEKFDTIDSAKANNGYEVYAWCDDDRSILATYAEENQAEEAKIAIFCSMRKGDKAMTMPYFVTEEETVKDGWHPVSDYPPKKKSHYWVQLCDSNGKYAGMHECIWTNSGRVYANTKTDWHWIGNPQFTKVVAWRKLPDIYTEEEQ